MTRTRVGRAAASLWLAAALVVSPLPGEAASPWPDVVDHARGSLLDASYHPWPTPLAALWPGAAVANAVYNATGIRVRNYPLTLDKYLDKLPAMV